MSETPKAPTYTPPANLQERPPLNRAILAAAMPGVQKQMIGERIYPKLLGFGPERAGKITGMMLELPCPDLMDMLEDEAKLWAAADQAIEVLDGVPSPPIPGESEWVAYESRRQRRAQSKRAASARCKAVACGSGCQ